MSHDEFTQLYAYMSREFNSLHDELDTKAPRNDLNRLINAFDAQAKQTEIYFHEMLAIGHKVDRHEGWIIKLANKAGLKLTA